MVTTIIKDKGKDRERKTEFDPVRLIVFIQECLDKVNVPASQINEYTEKVIRKLEIHDKIEAKEISDILIINAIALSKKIKASNGEITLESLSSINWDDFSRNVKLNELYKRASKNRSYDHTKKYGDFLGLVVTLVERGLYTKEFLEKYSDDEIREFGEAIDSERDKLFNYAGLDTFAERYLVTDFDNRSIFELPQERWMAIAMHEMIDEVEGRTTKVLEKYWSLSNLLETVATPTMSNAGRPNGGLSSCFVITTDDSLRGIYDDNTDAATFSKFGGGIGIYMGKVRSRGSSIMGYEGASSGIIPWIKQLDNTAVSVDQLGQRTGAIAVYLDAWHKDVRSFLELRLNTGDKKMRAHFVFTGLCIPDELVRKANSRGDWYLFDPHEIRQTMGFSLEDFYDSKKLREGQEPNEIDHAFTYHYNLCVDNNELSKTRVKAIDLYKLSMQSQLENGVPFMFYRDTANRDNPNKHEGMIYCSNLCTEIFQNMSATTVSEEYYDEDLGKLIVSKEVGDLVTCNLASLVLNRIYKYAEKNGEEFKDVLRRVIRIQVRGLDNVISLQRVPVVQAAITNLKYRAIGCGEQGRAALLAYLGIHWDSEKAIEYISELEELIMMYTIEASADLGVEKGSYKVFEGSEWNTGEWFEKRNLTSPEWLAIREKASSSMRNAWLRAIAPTGSTSIIGGSTASSDPVFDVLYDERKKDYQLPIIAPDLSPKTWFSYKPTPRFQPIDGEQDLKHLWTIMHHEVTARFVDQGISHNFYVTKDIKAKNLLRLHFETWERGIKSSYYVRPKSGQECIACS